jgi:hypothetical protein
MTLTQKQADGRAEGLAEAAARLEEKETEIAALRARLEARS